jgi:hypothetical protein
MDYGLRITDYRLPITDYRLPLTFPYSLLQARPSFSINASASVDPQLPAG